MKLRDIMIAWTPRTDKIALGPLPDKTDWSRGYLFTSGGCYSHIQTATPLRAKLHVYLLAHHMIVRDGMNPAQVHAALSNIDEYRDGLAEDIRPAPDRERYLAYGRWTG